MDFTDAKDAAAWMREQRKQRGWSTIQLADYARAIARREGSQLKLTQQTVSGFEQPDGAKRIPEWLRFVEMAFQEGAPSADQHTARRDDLVFIREVDISYAMGAGADVADYPDAQLVPFNLGFVQQLTRAPLERLFLATGHGESMEPTLLRHDLILIDTNQTRVAQQDQIWALTYAGAGMIKRLRRVKGPSGDRYRILSDNPQVPPEEAEFDDVHIVGKVIWIGRRM